MTGCIGEFVRDCHERWEYHDFDKLLSNEKYTGRVMLQKTISTGISQIKNDGLMDLYTATHEATISDEMFVVVQQDKLTRSKNPEKAVAIRLTS